MSVEQIHTAADDGEAQEDTRFEDERYQEVSTVLCAGGCYDILVGAARQDEEEHGRNREVHFPIIAHNGCHFSRQIANKLVNEHLERLSRTEFGLTRPGMNILQGRQTMAASDDPEDKRVKTIIVMQGG